MVAGIVAAKDNRIGVVGVAPSAPLWAVRVLGPGGNGEDSDLICGIDWVTATRADRGHENDIQVANMSLSGLGESNEQCGEVPQTSLDAVYQAICRSTAAGVTYVAAAGNEEEDFANRLPASHPNVLTATGMVDSDGKPGGTGAPDLCLGLRDDTAAYFSNFATLAVDQAHTIAAPAVCVSSTYIGSDVATDSGTSFAAPFVTGTVALCIFSGPCAGLSPAQIEQRMVADAAAYNNANPEYGFAGDPLHPIAGKYYGYLVHAGSY